MKLILAIFIFGLLVSFPPSTAVAETMKFIRLSSLACEFDAVGEDNQISEELALNTLPTIFRRTTDEDMQVDFRISLTTIDLKKIQSRVTANDEIELNHYAIDVLTLENVRALKWKKIPPAWQKGMGDWTANHVDQYASQSMELLIGYHLQNNTYSTWFKEFAEQVAQAMPRKEFSGLSNLVALFRTATSSNEPELIEAYLDILKKHELLELITHADLSYTFYQIDSNLKYILDHSSAVQSQPWTNFRTYLKSQFERAIREAKTQGRKNNYVIEATANIEKLFGNDAQLINEVKAYAALNLTAEN